MLWIDVVFYQKFDRRLKLPGGAGRGDQVQGRLPVSRHHFHVGADVMQHSQRRQWVLFLCEYIAKKGLNFEFDLNNKALTLVHYAMNIETRVSWHQIRVEAINLAPIQKSPLSHPTQYIKDDH